MPTTKIRNKTIKYKTTTRKGRKIVINILPDKTVLLKIPQDCQKNPKEILSDKADTILERIELLEKLEQLAKEYEPQLKTKLLLLGRFLDIEPIRAQKGGMVIQNDKITVFTHGSDGISLTLRNGLKRMLRRIILETIQDYSKKLGIKPKGLQIRIHKKSWGSCSSRGNLSINLKTIALPIEYIRYIVAHEFAHLIERRHTRRFWMLVKTLHPIEIKRDSLLTYEYLIYRNELWRRILTT